MSAESKKLHTVIKDGMVFSSVGAGFSAGPAMHDSRIAHEQRALIRKLAAAVEGLLESTAGSPNDHHTFHGFVQVERAAYNKLADALAAAVPFLED